MLEEIKKRLLDTKVNGEIKRIYPEEPDEIVKEHVEQNMEVSRPLYTIGIKDVPFGVCREGNNGSNNEIVRKHIAVEILLNLIFGESSNLYKKLYDKGNISSTPSMDYEFARGYAHILMSGQANDPDGVYEEFKKTVQKMKEEGINQQDFERIRKTIYGDYVKEYNDVTDIARMFLADYFKGINSFEYIEQIGSVNIQYVEQVLKEVFNENKMVLSVVRSAE